MFPFTSMNFGGDHGRIEIVHAMDVHATQSVGIRYCMIVFPMVGLGSMLVMYDSVNVDSRLMRMDKPLSDLIYGNTTFT